MRCLCSITKQASRNKHRRNTTECEFKHKLTKTKRQLVVHEDYSSITNCWAKILAVLCGMVGVFIWKANYLISVMPLKKKLGVFHHISKCLFTSWFLTKPVIISCWDLVGKRRSDQLTVALCQQIKTVSLLQDYGDKKQNSKLDNSVLLTSCQNSSL